MVSVETGWGNEGGKRREKKRKREREQRQKQRDRNWDREIKQFTLPTANHLQVSNMHMFCINKNILQIFSKTQKQQQNHQQKQT